MLLAAINVDTAHNTLESSYEVTASKIKMPQYTEARPAKDTDCVLLR